MKKRVLAGIMMAAMMVASVMSVSAAGSKTEEVDASKNEAGYTVEAKADTFKDLDAEVQNAIKDLNDDKIADSIVADIKDIKTTLSGKKLICSVFDLEPFGKHEQCDKDGFHTVKLNVPALKNCDPKSVVVLHYSEKNAKWETVEILKIDGTTITGKFYDLSPVAIYAKVTTGGAAGTSPSTVGTSSTWMLLAAVAVVALGAGVVATQKKSR